MPLPIATECMAEIHKTLDRPRNIPQSKSGRIYSCYRWVNKHGRSIFIWANSYVVESLSKAEYQLDRLRLHQLKRCGREEFYGSAAFYTEPFACSTKSCHAAFKYFDKNEGRHPRTTPYSSARRF